MPCWLGYLKKLSKIKSPSSRQMVDLGVEMHDSTERRKLFDGMLYSL